jgi:hypothetical protein
LPDIVMTRSPPSGGKLGVKTSPGGLKVAVLFVGWMVLCLNTACLLVLPLQLCPPVPPLCPGRNRGGEVASQGHHGGLARCYAGPLALSHA